jgi:hypothetical protein
MYYIKLLQKMLPTSEYTSYYNIKLVTNSNNAIRISPSITLKLEKSGQTITVDFEEAKEIVKSLSNFLNQGGSTTTTTTAIGRSVEEISAAKREGGGKGGAIKVPYMSENKRKEIIKHISRQLSTKPKTLSTLLKGVSYIPNYLPAIRQMVENQGNIHKEKIGKRTYYSKK